MKNIIILGFIFLIAVSCKEEEIQKFNDLDSARQDAIRSRGTTICLNEKTAVFARFKERSNAVFTSSAYERGDGFEFILNNGTSNVNKIEIKIWKQTATAIYFYISDDRSNGDYFLRIRKTDNEEMIDDLLSLYCKRPQIYTSSVGENGPLKMVYDHTLSRSSNFDVHKDSFTMPFSSLVFFANYQVSRTIKVEDVNRNMVSTTNYTSTLNSKAYTFVSDNPELFEKKYCNLTRGSSGYRFASIRNVIGFNVDLTTCTDVLPGDWNITIP